MYNYSIYSVDKNGRLYCDFILSDIILKGYFKVGEYLEETDEKPKRKITTITGKGF
ncbi:MAG: hypothetical protein Q9M94_05505 [Candidatus Gracilibacteria bacterium]|nr:hypothetical protein [Candidatus Gracilibacteria bacterium]